MMYSLDSLLDYRLTHNEEKIGTLNDYFEDPDLTEYKVKWRTKFINTY